MGDGIETSAEAMEAAVMAPGRAVHSDPAVGPTAEQEPLPKGMARTPVEKKSPAQWAFERLILSIRSFEKSLDSEHEVAMGLTQTGGGLLRIEGLGYFDPDIVTFYGTDPDGQRTQLVQHVSQLNVILRAARKPDPDAAPRRIGFELARSLEDEDAANGPQTGS